MKIRFPGASTRLLQLRGLVKKVGSNLGLLLICVCCKGASKRLSKWKALVTKVGDRLREKSETSHFMKNVGKPVTPPPGFEAPATTLLSKLLEYEHEEKWKWPFWLRLFLKKL